MHSFLSGLLFAVVVLIALFFSFQLYVWGWFRASVWVLERGRGVTERGKRFWELLSTFWPFRIINIILKLAENPWKSLKNLSELFGPLPRCPLPLYLSTMVGVTLDFGYGVCVYVWYPLGTLDPEIANRNHSAISSRSDLRTQSVGCVIAQAFFSRGASAIALKSRVFPA